MVLGASRRVATALLATLIGAACSLSPSAPAAPTPTPPQTPSAVRAAIDITSISVSSERAAGGGYRYRLVLDLRETAGVAARVDGVDLTFTKGGETLATSRPDQPLASAPAAPTPTPPQTPSAVRAAIDITSISVSSERAAGGGYRYRLVLDLRETAGVAARVDGVDLTFTKGGETLATSRHDQPLASGTTVAARGTAATRELVTTDANAAHASATRVTARLAFSEATDAQSSATASTDVPAPRDAAAALFTLTGKITD